MLSLEQARKKFNSDKKFNVEDTTTLDYARKQYKENGNKINVQYNADEIKSWFNDVNREFNNLSNPAQKDVLSYEDALNMRDKNSSLTELRSQSDFVRSYIDSLKGTKQYDELNKQFNDYSKGIDSLLDYTKGVSDFASQFKSADEYDQVVTEAKRNQKYSALSSYDDYLKAIDNTDDEDEKNWLEKRAYSVAKSDDIQNDISAVQNEIDTLEKEYPLLNNYWKQEVSQRKNTGLKVGESKIPEFIGDEPTKFDKEILSKYDTLQNSKSKKQTDKEVKEAEETLAERNEKLAKNYYNLSPQERTDVLNYL
ncbi:MAG: hypothetical protein IJ725_02110, partial [Ruminococcus sp.]|nr:hypothetical protein [Ruminococcus sp.]